MLTLEKLLTLLPLLRVAEIERRCGFPPDKIQNWKRKRSAPTQEELNQVQEVLKEITQFQTTSREALDDLIDKVLTKPTRDKTPEEIMYEIAIRKEILRHQE